MGRPHSDEMFKRKENRGSVNIFYSLTMRVSLDTEES